MCVKPKPSSVCMANLVYDQSSSTVVLESEDRGNCIGPLGLLRVNPN